MNEIEKILYDLMMIPSISSDIQQLDEITQYVENYFGKGENIFIKKYIFNQKPSLVIQNFEGKDADIMLNGHLDIVPFSEENQHIPKIEDDKIYGRGSGDMKGGVAIMMKILKEVFEQNYQEKKIALMLSNDEETGGFDGVKLLVEREKYAPKSVLIPDSGDLYNIVIAEKGMIRLNVEIFGKSSHASRPWLGENALEKVYLFYEDLKNTFGNNKDFQYPDYWKSSVSLTVISGGEVSNMIPGSAKATFDIRLTEDFGDMEKNQEIIQKLLSKHDGKILNILTGDLLSTDENCDFVQKYALVVEKVLGKKPNLIKEHGASDGRFFAGKGIPVILHRPTCANIHAKGEYVERESLQKIYECYKEFVFGK